MDIWRDSGVGILMWGCLITPMELTMEVWGWMDGYSAFSDCSHWVGEMDLLRLKGLAELAGALLYISR